MRLLLTILDVSWRPRCISPQFDIRNSCSWLQNSGQVIGPPDWVLVVWCHVDNNVLSILNAARNETVFGIEQVYKLLGSKTVGIMCGCHFSREHRGEQFVVLNELLGDSMALTMVSFKKGGRLLFGNQTMDRVYKLPG